MHGHVPVLSLPLDLLVVVRHHVFPRFWLDGHKYKCNFGRNKNISGSPSDVRQRICPKKPNKTKPPLQVLAVTKGNSEKIKAWDEAHGHIGLSIVWVNSYYCKHKSSYSYFTLCFSHFPLASGLESGVDGSWIYWNRGLFPHPMMSCEPFAFIEVRSLYNYNHHDLSWVINEVFVSGVRWAGFHSLVSCDVERMTTTYSSAEEVGRGGKWSFKAIRKWSAWCHAQRILLGSPAWLYSWAASCHPSSQ